MDLKRRFTIPQPASDETEIALLRVIQRETHRRQAAEQESKKLRQQMAKCPRCREAVRT